MCTLTSKIGYADHSRRPKLDLLSVADRPMLTELYEAGYEDNGVDILMTPTTAIPTTPISATEPYVYFEVLTTADTSRPACAMSGCCCN